MPEQDFFRTREYPDLEEFLDKIKETAEALIADLSFEPNILGCGIGAPNASSKRGTIEEAANLAWKGVVPFIETFPEEMGCSHANHERCQCSSIG